MQQPYTVRFRSVATGIYLCMNRKGRLYTSCKRSTECEFLSRIEKSYFTTLESKKHSGRYIVIGSDRRIKRARRLKGKPLVEDHFFLEFKKNLKDTDRVFRGAFSRDSPLLQHCAEYVPTFPRDRQEPVGSLSPNQIETTTLISTTHTSSTHDLCRRRNPGSSWANSPFNFKRRRGNKGHHKKCHRGRSNRRRRPRRRCKTERCRKRRRRWRRKHKKRLRKNEERSYRGKGQRQHPKKSTTDNSSSSSSNKNDDKNSRISSINTNKNKNNTNKIISRENRKGSNNDNNNNDKKILNSASGISMKIRRQKPKTVNALTGSRRRWRGKTRAKAHSEVMSNARSSVRHRTRHKHYLRTSEAVKVEEGTGNEDTSSSSSFVVRPQARILPGVSVDESAFFSALGEASERGNAPTFRLSFGADTSPPPFRTAPSSSPPNLLRHIRRRRRGRNASFRQRPRGRNAFNQR